MIVNQVIHGDCLEVMRTLPDKSIGMILCDLPYGTTQCKWDTIIPFEPLWFQYKRLIKDNGAIVLTASQPFTSALVMSNPENYKHSWVWNKLLAGNAVLSKKQPLKIHEDIVVFGYGKSAYNPIMTTGRKRKKNGIKNKLGTFTSSPVTENDQYYPKSIIEFSNAHLRNSKIHLTQKPVALFEYLIRTYTNEGETVLDNCAGSGTTAIACLNTNRKYILIEKEQEYIDIINKRITEHEQQLTIGVIQ